ncbi:MAG: imidazolonepropionase [Planctomycetes bacterium]|nr:imidazolonepropionase [Planctomycetota bacterium]
MKEQVDLVLTDCSEVVTLAGGSGPLTGAAMDDLALVAHGAVAVRDGLVLDVDERSVIEARYDARRRVSAEGGTVLPGFCDVHTHPVFTATREGEFDMRARGATYQEITAAGGGIFSSVRALRAAAGERDVLARGLEARLDRFLACGTTTIEAKSGYGLDLATELLSLELLAEAHASHPVDIDPTCLAAHQVPPEHKADRTAYVRLVVDEILPAAARAGLARSADVFCDQGAFTVEEARAILVGAKQLGLALRVHADELAPVGASELAGELGAQTADHLVRISDDGIAALRAGGTTAVLLPATCFSLRLRDYAPFARLLEAGVPVALATDFNPGTSYVPSMIEVIALACGLLGMTVAQAVTAATRNAAETLGLPGVRGRIEPGAVADLVVLDIPNHLFLGYQAGWNPVATVIKHGRVAWRRGTPGPLAEPSESS